MLAWIAENWTTLLALLGATVALFGLIARLTPTPVDDRIASVLKTVLGFLKGVKTPPTEPELGLGKSERPLLVEPAKGAETDPSATPADLPKE